MKRKKCWEAAIRTPVILPVWRKKDSQIINYLRRKLGKQGLQRESQVSVTSGDEGNNQRSWGHRAFID